MYQVYTTWKSKDISLKGGLRGESSTNSSAYKQREETTQKQKESCVPWEQGPIKVDKGMILEGLCFL